MVGAVQEYGRVVISEVNNGLGMMNGFESRATTKQQPRSEEEEKESKWYEEEIDDDLKLCYALNRYYIN
jgi:thermospermine synthase